MPALTVTLQRNSEIRHAALTIFEGYGNRNALSRWQAKQLVFGFTNCNGLLLLFK